MTTYDFTTGSLADRGVQKLVEDEHIKAIRGIVDFSEQNIAVNTIAKAVAIPAKTTVLFVSALAQDDVDGNLPTGYTTGNATISVGYGLTAAVATTGVKWGSSLVITAEQYGAATADPSFAPVYFSDASTVNIVPTTVGGAVTSINQGAVEVIAYTVKHNNIL